GRALLHRPYGTARLGPVASPPASRLRTAPGVGSDSAPFLRPGPARISRPAHAAGTGRRPVPHTPRVRLPAPVPIPRVRLPVRVRVAVARGRTGAGPPGLRPTRRPVARRPPG